MLWHKAWLETRWRFLAGLAILTVLAGGNVYDYLVTSRLLPPLLAATSDAPEPSGELQRMLREAIEIQREFRGFVWWQAFRQNLSQLGTLFAVLLGCGSLLSEASRGSALFTLSLPISRRRLIGTRLSLGLAQCLALGILPPLIIPALAPAVGQHYPVVDALAHGVCLFFVSAVFFSLASLLSTVFPDIWRPLLLACGAAVVLAIAEQVAPGYRTGLFRVMSGEQFFRTGTLPWTGLLVSATLSAVLLYGAVASLERREF